MEQSNVSLETFFLHLKDILSLYCPKLVNEFKSFEKGLLKTKNRLQTHQTLQFYFNQIKKSTTDKKLKAIITIWKSKFKDAFIEDKILLYLVQMYLFYQIETSIDFLIEGGRISPLEKEIKEKELKDQCMEKLSLKAGTKLNYEEYDEVINQPEIKKEDFNNVNDNKVIDKETNEDIDQSIINQHNQPQSQSEETIEATIQSSNTVVMGNASSSSMPVSLEEKLLAMEDKISHLVKVEEELSALKGEVKDLKESVLQLQSKCNQYEIIKIIKAFFKHLCLIFDIPYSSYRIAFIIPSLTNNDSFASYLHNNNININKIEELISIYYDIKLKMSIQNGNSNNEYTNNLIDKYSSLFNTFSFSPNKGDLINYSSVQSFKNRFDK